MINIRRIMLVIPFFGIESEYSFYAGRITLAQSCITSLPEYVIQYTIIHISTCDEVVRVKK